MHLGICPVRISFAGGGTDMPEYYEIYGGNVVTTSINRFTYVMINRRGDDLLQVFSSDFQAHNTPTAYDNLEPQRGTELPVSAIKFLNFKEGINLIISSDVPPGSGLGGSSSLTVNLVKTISTLKGQNLDNHIIAEKAFQIARNVLQWPLGKQDEYISAYGGFNFIKFEKEKIEVLPIKLSINVMEELQQNLILFFIGGRSDSTILSSQIDRIKRKDKKTLDSLAIAKKLGETMYLALKKSDITKFGEILHKGWMAKKNFVKGISDNHIDQIYDSAIANGAIGGKLTGAGGGGHLLLYCEKSKQKSMIKKLESLGLRNVNFRFHEEGAKILNLYDYYNS